MDEELRISAGSTDITPSSPIPLFGRSLRSGPFQDIADPLEVNALVLRQGAGTAVLLSADLLYFSDVVRENVLPALSKRYGLDEASVFFAATHTHSAPAVDGDKPMMGTADTEYIRLVSDRIGALLDKLLSQEGASSEIHYGSSRAHHSVNRRKFGWTLAHGIFPKKIIMNLPNFHGPNDEMIRCILFKDEEERPLCVIWSYACHPVGDPRIHHVSPDFPGAIRCALRRSFQSEKLPVLFLFGFGGNIRPLVLEKRSDLRARLRQKINGPYFPEEHGAFTMEEYSRWSASLSDCAWKAIRNATRIQAHPDLRYRHEKIPLSDLVDSYRGSGFLTIRKLQLAAELGLVGISAEVVMEYLEHLHEIFPWSHIIPVSCIDSVFGYLPTRSMVKEGGYEGKDFFPSFDLEGRFNASIEDIVVNHLRCIAQSESY